MSAEQSVDPCRRGRGWYCTRRDGHEGPCALWPRLTRHPIWWLRSVGWPR